MENKYYTPEIEDIRVNYECEMRQADIWEFYRVQNNDCLCDFVDMDGIRTPFLTEKQIEADGWEVYPIVMPNQDWVGFSKDNYMLLYYCLNNDISKPCIKILAKDVTLLEWMGNFPEMFRVTLPCLSINEFRFICKLLKIN